MMIKIVQKASVKVYIILMMQKVVFVIRIVSRVQVVILTEKDGTGKCDPSDRFKMRSHVMEMAGVNKFRRSLILNIYVNVVKVTTTKIPV